MAKRYNINGIVFETKSELEREIHRMVKTYREYETLAPSDLAFMKAILDLSPTPKRDAKVGPGIKRMYVRRNHPYPHMGFWIERVDGTKTDFSWLKCLTPTPHKTEVAQALRYAVMDQTSGFREKFFLENTNPTCPLTGQKLTHETSHVDHQSPTFMELMAEFLAVGDRDLTTIEVNATEDGSMITRLVDPELSGQWQEYHRTHANLRMLSQDGNLSIAKRKSTALAAPR